MSIEPQHPASWTAITKASFLGVAAAWVGYAIWSAIDAYTGPSNDIAIAILPAVLAISVLVALLLFWPIIIGMARLGTIIARTHDWARQWWAWAVIGAVSGGLTLCGFMGILSAWSAELLWATIIGAAFGAAAALITHSRLGVGRYT